MATAKRHRLTVGEPRAQVVRLEVDVFRDRPRDEAAIDAAGHASALRAAGIASEAGPP